MTACREEITQAVQSAAGVRVVKKTSDFGSSTSRALGSCSTTDFADRRDRCFQAFKDQYFMAKHRCSMDGTYCLALGRFYLGRLEASRYFEPLFSNAGLVPSSISTID